MRCKSCNKRLTDSELRVKNPRTNDFEDLCKNCRASVTVSLLELEGSYVSTDLNESTEVYNDLYNYLGCTQEQPDS